MVTITYVAQKESGFPKRRVLSRCNNVSAVTDTFFSFGIFSTVYYIERCNRLYREILSAKVLTMQLNIHMYMGQIFSDDAAKKKRATSVTMKINGPLLI